MTETTNQATTETKEAKPQNTRAPRERRERGPPADGIPSRNKVMVANLPYDLHEDKVYSSLPPFKSFTNSLIAQGTFQRL